MASRQKNCYIALSELGYGIRSAFDNVLGQRIRVIGFPHLIFFQQAKTVFTPAGKILRGNPKSRLLCKPPFA